MRIPIENFYISGSANINNLWYEDGTFSVQREDRSLFQISKNNTDKSLQGISPEQVEKAKKIGYFTIVESLGFSGDYSIRHTYRLFGGGNGSSHESNHENASSQNEPSRESNSDNASSHKSSNNDCCDCGHNDRSGVSIADIVEHAGNLDFGSAGRDFLDLLSAHESFGGFNQAPSSKSETSSSHSSSADASKTGSSVDASKTG
ncbi:MAG: hypothetical protein LBC45_01885 [Chlamydiales bacterium]|jgi:hypothetical protein|nr:hypothetical protein [Chlamydiales bacterium]